MDEAEGAGAPARAQEGALTPAAFERFTEVQLADAKAREREADAHMMEADLREKDMAAGWQYAHAALEANERVMTKDRSAGLSLVGGVIAAFVVVLCVAMVTGHIEVAFRVVEVLAAAAAGYFAGRSSHRGSESDG